MVLISFRTNTKDCNYFVLSIKNLLKFYIDDYITILQFKTF